MKPSLKGIPALLLLSLFLLQCGEETDQLTGNELLNDLQAETNSILADGISDLYLVASVVDSAGDPLAGALVSFTATAGSVTPRAYTDQNGEAVATLTSAASEADIEATVTSKIIPSENGSRAGSFAGLTLQNRDGSPRATLEKPGSIEATEARVIIYFVGITLTAQLDKSELCADGLSQGQLRVALKESASKRGVANAAIQVRRTTTTLQTSGKTDGNGNAVIAILSATSTGADTLLVEYGPLFKRTLPIVYQAPRISLLPEGADLLADGYSTLNLSATLVSPSNNPITGAAIQFSCSDGVITGSALTGENGEAVALYRGGSSPKRVKVIARFHDWADTTLITLVDSAPSQMQLTAAKELLRNGISETPVKVTFLNTMQKPVAGARVRFVTTAGTIDSVAVTDEQGQAAVILRSDAGSADLTTTVRVTAAGITGQITVLYTGVTLQLTGSPTSLPADGLSTSTISALLKKTTSNQAIANVELELGTTLGQLPATLTTDASGRAQTTFQSGIQPGTSLITARYGLLSATIELVMIVQKPVSLQLNVDSHFIWVTGTGLSDLCNITATAVGANGKPFQDELKVKFVLRNGPNGGEMLLPNEGNPLESAVQKSAAGSASIACKSGTRSGTVEIQAWLVDCPEVASRSTQITIRSGPPYIWIDPADPNHVESHMTVALDYFNLDGWSNVRQFQVTIYVGDKYNNPVEEGTSLYLTSTAGIVTTNTRTDADGRGTAIWTTANPRPAIAPGDPAVLAPHRVPNPNAPGTVLNVTLPDFEGSLVRNSAGTLTENDGIGLVMCTTRGRDQAGNDAVVFGLNSAVFSGGVLVFDAAINATVLRPGETAAIAVRVYDLNGNPLAKGSTLTASANAGKLSTTELMAPAERYSYGTTYFATTVMNNLEPTDKSKMAEVTLRLDSPNGTGVRTVQVYLLNN